jgi:integrase
LDALIDAREDAAERRYGISADGHPDMPQGEVDAIRLSHSVLAGAKVTLLSDAVTRYLRETKPRVTAATLNAKERQISAFQKWMEYDVDVRSITRLQAGRYLSEELLTRDAAVKTTRGELSSLSALWAYLEVGGEVDSNVWFRLSGRVKESTRGTGAKRRSWTADELLSLLTQLEEGDVLVPLAALGAYTGCRINELAELKLTDVDDDAWRVTSGKSDAAVRYVPLTPTIRPLVARLKKASTDKYLFPGLLSGGTDNRRSHMVSKRFGASIRRLGFADPALTFHSLRNTLIQNLEEAGAVQSTVQLVVGHARSSITYGGYSKGISQEKLQQAVAQVSYGASVDAFVTDLGNTFKLKTRSRRRHKRAA